jgi:hypothetical protein
MPRIRRPIDADGAVINVEVGVGAIDEADLRLKGLFVPSPFATTALIDTGASRTSLHPMIVRNLQLIPRDFEPVWTAGPTGPVKVNVAIYHANLTLGGYPAPRFLVEAAEIVPATPTVLVILGRDILNECSLLFDGKRKSFRLRF